MAEVETDKDIGADAAATVELWTRKIELAEKAAKPWEDAADEVLERYRD